MIKVGISDKIFFVHGLHITKDELWFAPWKTKPMTGILGSYFKKIIFLLMNLSTCINTQPIPSMEVEKCSSHCVFPPPYISLPRGPSLKPLPYWTRACSQHSVSPLQVHHTASTQNNNAMFFYISAFLLLVYMKSMGTEAKYWYSKVNRLKLIQ